MQTIQQAGISYYDDAGGFHVREYHVCHRSGVPEWTRSLPAIRKVVCARAWAVIHRSKPMPATIAIENYKLLDSQVAAVVFARAAARPNRANREAAALIKQFGSYMELQTQILWRRWRLEQDTRTIAADLDVPYWRVMETLNKLRRTAVRLGLVPGQSQHDRRADNNRRMAADPAFRAKKRQGAARQWANPEIKARMIAAQRARRERERKSQSAAASE